MIRTYNLRDSYNGYYKENCTYPRIDVDSYMRIVSGFMKFIADKILAGFQVKFGGGDSMGTLAIVGKKPKISIGEDGFVKGLAPNWGETMKLWKEHPDLKEKKQIVFCTNEHTNGIKYNLVWWKTGMKIGNKYLYTFVYAKTMKRALTKALRDGKEYIVYL